MTQIQVLIPTHGQCHSVGGGEYNTVTGPMSHLTQGWKSYTGWALDIWHETFVNLLLRDNIYYHDDDDYDYIDYDDNDIDGCDIELVKSLLSQS